MKRILVAPLYWGLGHSTRCIPIINALLSEGFEPVLASDGSALDLLKKEFPALKAFELPSYNISYPKKGTNFKKKLLKNSLHILKTIEDEKKYIEDLIKSETISGIISDNRFGVRSNLVPSVYITHQVNVLSGSTSWLSSALHQNSIKKFDECWVPDFEFMPNLSGKLGHPKKKLKNIRYIGPLSRFKKQVLKRTIDLLVILSGPEPQRTQLENKLMTLLKDDNRNIVFVRGIVEQSQTSDTKGNIKIYNYMTSKDLETTINSSKLIISRSGYTTIMDLAKLNKRAIFIPTPGQYEQLYLADILSKQKIVPNVTQDKMSKIDLEFNSEFSGFQSFNSNPDFKSLFRLF